MKKLKAIQFRCDPTEAKKLEREAEYKNVSVAKFIRSKVLKDPLKF